MSRSTVKVLTTAIVLAVMVTSAHASLLAYEPFDYADGSDLAGQGGTGIEQGFAASSTWSTFTTGQAGSPTHFVQVHGQGQQTGVLFNNSPSQFPNPYTNTITNLPAAGNFVGRNDDSGIDGDKGADHIILWREIAPSVTATFQDGTTTWFSFVAARGFNLNARAPTFAIGEGVLIEDRGNNATGPVIAVGGYNNAGGEFWAQYKDTAGDGPLTRDTLSSGNTFNGGTAATSDEMVNIVVAKIEWGATSSDPDLVSFARFLDSDTLDQATFNANASTPFGAALDQSLFNQLSVGGGRFFVDELRIATTFDDVIGGGSVIPGDTDGDGDIDDSDLGTSFSNYTGPVGAAGGKTAADGDTDGDGDVDDSDLGTSFSGYTGPLGPSSVPEPTSFALLGLGAVLALRRRN